MRRAQGQHATASGAFGYAISQFYNPPEKRS